MKLEALTRERVIDFVQYCKNHIGEIDDSFLSDEELNHFVNNADNPTYIVSNEQGELVAVASLIIDEYNRRGKRARFRIFHSEIDELAYYHMLMQALLPHTEGLEKIFIFIPLTNRLLASSIERLNFSLDRYSFLLVREDMDVPVITLPRDFRICSFQRGKDEEIWCNVRNEGFAKLKGNETPITPEILLKNLESQHYIEGGMKILFHNERPIGVVKGEVDEYEGSSIMHIGPLAIIPEYQGKGLGRILLREILYFAKEKTIIEPSFL